MKVLGVYREEMFSPGRVDDDRAIMDTTLAFLRSGGHETDSVKAESLNGQSHDADCVLTMGQSGRVLRILEESQTRGVRIVNPVTSIRLCNRAPLMCLLAQAGLPLPQGEILPIDDAERRTQFHPGKHYWLKRGDAHKLEPGDVAKVTSLKEFKSVLARFRTRHIEEVLVQEHLEGQVVKFYGISTGPASWDHYFAAFPEGKETEITEGTGELRAVGRRAAAAVGLEVYGGDAVITPSGRVVLIDLNAWPSFSRCRKRAAENIAGYVARTQQPDLPALSTQPA